jgi:putative peptidoglycan lipid II flippase
MTDLRPADDATRPTAPAPPALTAAAAAVAAVLVAGRVAALIKEIAVAAWFGNRETTDAFYLGWLAPAALANTVGAALEIAIIPHLVRRRRERLAAWQLFRAAARRTVNATLIAAGVLMLLARPIMAVLVGPGAGGPAADPGSSAAPAAACGAPGPVVDPDAAVECLRITAVYLPAHVFIFLLSGALAANRMFAASVSWMVVSSATTAAVLWFGSDQPGRPAAALAYATVIGYGAALLWMIALTAFVSPGQSARPVGAIQLRAELGSILRNAWPLAVAGAMTQVNLLVDGLFAARLYDGAMSSLQRAGLIAGTVVLLITRSLFRPALVGLAEADAPGRAALWPLLRPVLLVGVPAAAVLAVLAEPLTRLVLERGSFGPGDTAAVAEALRWFAPGTVFAAAAGTASAALAAARRNWAAAACPAIAAALHVPLNFALLAVWPSLEHRHAALAASGSITAVLTAALVVFTVARLGRPATPTAA